jgi:outer membrane protein assembly factor BamB
MKPFAMCRRFAVIGALCASMVSCGGGSDIEPPYRATPSPGTLSASVDVGAPKQFNIELVFDRALSRAVTATLADDKAVFVPTVPLTFLSGNTYRLSVSLSTLLAAGRYQGSVQLRLCMDAPTVCNSPLSGSPFVLPYDITVTAPPAKPLALFSPPTVVVAAALDEVPAIRIRATFDADSPVYPQFVGTPGVFQVNPPSSVSGSVINTTLFLERGLAAGRYQGQIELRLCKDLPCTQQLAGSPVMLPYNLDLAPLVNLTPLVRWSGVPEWAQHQANVSHTGYAPVILDASKFNRRWKWTIPNLTVTAGAQILPVVSSDGVVYAVTSGFFSEASIFALSEADKSVRWRHNFGSIFAANPASTDTGSLFLLTGGQSETFVWSFDATTGAQRFKSQVDSQWQRVYAPAVAGGSVFTNAGANGGLLSLNASDGVRNWFATLPQYDQWTPAIDGGTALAYLPNGLNLIDAQSGVVSYVIADPGNAVVPYSVYAAPMLVAPASAVVVSGLAVNNVPNRLVNFDTQQRVIKWSIPGAFLHAPATAAGVIYVVNGTQLEARRELDGSRLWAWTPPESAGEPFRGDFGDTPANLVLTNNLVFVSTGSRVYAVSLASQQAVWSYPKAGRLALSPSGVLYIVTSPKDGEPAAIVAINLQ